MVILIYLYKVFLNFVYLFVKLFKTREQVTIISRQSNTKTVDIALLEKKLNELLPDVKTVVLCKKIGSSLKEKIIYFFYIFKLMYHISRSKVVVLDSYCIPISMLRHKKDLKVIQMWHAIGLLKKAGFSNLDTEEGRNRKLAIAMKMHSNYDYAFTSSKDSIKAMSQVFNISEDKIVVNLLPRVDLLRNKKYLKEKKNEIIDIYPEISKKKNILYIPTFRKDEKLMEEKINELINAIDYKKYNLIIKLHPNSKINIDDSRVVTDNNFSSMEMLSVADYVISDYSSIIYEAMVLEKPVYFYAFDLDQYEIKRGLFIDYVNEMPGLVTGSGKELFNEINNKKYDFNKQEMFKNKYLDLSKKDNTVEIVNLIKQNLQN